MFNAKSKNLWLNLNSSLWFVPTLIVFVAAGLAILFIYMDATGDFAALTDNEFLFGAGAAGARGMLGAIGSSMITVAGLIFSLTISTLAQASSQYTPRILRITLIWRLLQYPLILLFVVTAFGMLYYFAPNIKQRNARTIVFGTLVGVVLWLGLSFGLKQYLRHFSKAQFGITIIEI